MSDTPRTDSKLERIRRLGWSDWWPEMTSLAASLERENATLRNYLMTLASDGAKPGDAKTLWRKVRGEML